MLRTDTQATAASTPWMTVSPKAETEDSDAHTSRVLIADDQPDVLEAMRMLLKPAGYEVEVACSPRIALEQLKKKQFDAIVIDLNYTLDTTSGNEGMDLLSAIKDFRADIPVIIMTAWATMDIAIEAMRRGACDFIQKPWNNAQVLATIGAQVARRHLQAREFRAQREEIDDARSVQQALLRRELPAVAGFEIAAWSRPAREFGGDYYGIFENENRVTLVIADVCGKGIGAALTMSNLQGTLKSLARDETSPAALCDQLNCLLRPSMLEGRFISLFCAILDTGSGRLRFCNAGHQPPLAMTKAGHCRRLETGGAVLGHFVEWPYQDDEISLCPGDSLLLFTDGIVEAGNSMGAEFGEAGILTAARKAQPGAASLRESVTTALMHHCRNGFEDDATLLVLHRK